MPGRLFNGVRLWECAICHKWYPTLVYIGWIGICEHCREGRKENEA